ncbi:cytochrome c peroxidase [uncultured Pseudoteredinibacter sp.]|uniref:cytochrome-c peroxidase n=1 Tax=uncultured Pseudoteredinibacter sp. TaxID=1641701 RepID=UPI002613D006|nr:cytochrome c peroxidase [uncultured Pseudoteredinibacter sp.]
MISSLILAAGISLSSHCPAGFEKVEGNRCELRTVYQFYDSLQNRGVGGTQTSLPKHVDGYSPQQIDLGRYLFFDPILSANQVQSCASCHQPDKGFSDGHGRSVGFDGKLLPRSAPSLWNSAFLDRFFWDGRAKTLEEQAKGPLYAPEEMNNKPVELLERLNRNKEYQRLFSEAFPGSTVIEEPQLLMVLAAFQASLISLNSRYDRYAHGDHKALNAEEIAGMNVFRSFVARCSECHTPPLFTNNQIAVIGTPEPEGMVLDIGAEKTFNSSVLKGGFKVPTLRNIEFTAPYMHSGVFPSLREATEFYNKGRGHAVPNGVEMQIHWHIWEPNLKEEELDLIVSFMKTLSDETFKPETPKQLPSGLPVLADIPAASKESKDSTPQTAMRR